MLNLSWFGVVKMLEANWLVVIVIVVVIVM